MEDQLPLRPSLCSQRPRSQSPPSFTTQKDDLSPEDAFQDEQTFIQQLITQLTELSDQLKLEMIAKFQLIERIQQLESATIPPLKID